MGTHHKSMQTECFTMLLLAFLANAVASDDHKAASWLTKMLTNSNVELKRNGESVNANPEFWGVRGKRSSEGVDTYLLDDAESKRALKPNSLFGSISKKMLKPNSLFNTVGKKSLKPNSLFNTMGKRNLKPNSLFGTLTKKSLKPNSLFGTIGKKDMNPNSLFTAYGKRNMKPNGLFSMAKRSIVPYFLIYDEDADSDYEVEEEGEEQEEDENGSEEENQMLTLKRSSDPSFWAARGKREAMGDFFAARGRRSGAEVVVPTDFDFFAARG